MICLSAAVGTACSTARAATPIERPALEVPPPPPRVIVPLPPAEAPQPEPVPGLPPETSAGAPARPRPQNNKPTDPAKPEAKPETPTTDPQPQQQATPPPQLRTPEGANAQLANQIRDTINRVTATLDRIDPNTLSEPRKKAHTDARLFARQADESLKSGNLVFAREMADKAERLAKELQSR